MTLVRGVDTPRTVWQQSVETLLNFGNTTNASGPPECGVAFVAPTSGRVLLLLGGGLRDSSGNNRVFLGPEVFVGPDSSGTQVESGSFHEFVSSPPETESIYGSRAVLVEGLTAGETHYARLYHYTALTGGTPAATSDIFVREIIVVPLS